MGKFQVSPILNLIENLTENITLADVDMSIGQIMRSTNWGESLIDVGKSFITPESSPLGKNHLNWRLFTKIFFLAMISRYFMLSGIPMSQMTICKEIQNMISTLEKDLDFFYLDNFKFITEKFGRRGPSKEECIKYYNEKLVILSLN